MAVPATLATGRESFWDSAKNSVTTAVSSSVKAGARALQLMSSTGGKITGHLPRRN